VGRSALERISGRFFTGPRKSPGKPMGHSTSPWGQRFGYGAEPAELGRSRLPSEWGRFFLESVMINSF
jgi:hypothetical protein